MKTGIVYIEDNAFNMRLMRRIFGTTSFELYEAFDGTSGLEMVRLLMPQLVLIDINLPDIDGLQIVRILKKDPATSHLPCVALTANAMSGDRERCLNAGFDDYLAKPVVRRELLDVLETYLGPSQTGHMTSLAPTVQSPRSSPYSAAAQ
ncbi:MAG: response regulator [Anaerolineae bacterium]|nr:response regulator [Anaerolineae bacterium]MCA9888043.1 response regulator [Anaerolineae bacterium]MCA9894957.1 response regulator [Anaerolineae bacterium]